MRIFKSDQSTISFASNIHPAHRCVSIALLTVLFVITQQGLNVQLVNSAQFIPDSAISGNIPRKSELAPSGETNAVCIGNTPGVSPSITLCNSIDLTGKSLLFKLPEYAVAALPASHPLAIVTDGSTSSDCVKGGGSTRVLCAWNGSAWASIGGGGGGTGDVTEVQGTQGEICITNSTGPIPIAQLCSTVTITSKILQVGRIDLASIITPSPLAALTDNWNPTGLSTASTIRVSGLGPYGIGGIAGGQNGRILTLHIIGSYPITLLNEYTGSTQTNRFSIGADMPLSPGQAIALQYDGTSGYWRALGNAQSTSVPYCAANSGSDAYACNMSPVLTAYTIGRHYSFKADVANTGTATLQLNSIPTPVPIKKQLGGSAVDLITNDIRIGQIVDVVYDGTNFQMVSQLGNSPTGLSGLTTNTVPRAASATTLENSGISEDASNTLITLPPIFGDCATNCLTEDRSAISGAKTHTYPNHTGTVPISPNARKTVSIELFDPTTDVASGDGKLYFRVPSNLNGMELVAVASNAVTAGTTGVTSVQITRCAAVATTPLCSGTTQSMLSTVLSIDSGETSSSTAATAAVIDATAGNRNVTTAQILRFDVTAVTSTAPKGLFITTEWELP